MSDLVDWESRSGTAFSFEKISESVIPPSVPGLALRAHYTDAPQTKYITRTTITGQRHRNCRNHCPRSARQIIRLSGPRRTPRPPSLNRLSVGITGTRPPVCPIYRRQGVQPCPRVRAGSSTGMALITASDGSTFARARLRLVAEDLFAAVHSVQQYSNEVPAPKDQPRRPQGSYPVIVRLVVADGSEEWRPSNASRWTATAVPASWQQQPGDPRSVIHAWLPLADVARINRPAVR